MPKVSVEAVNVHALLQIGNVTQMFVGTAGSCKSYWRCKYILIGRLEKDQEELLFFLIVPDALILFLNEFECVVVGMVRLGSQAKEAIIMSAGI